MERWILLIIGYAFGLFQTGYIFGRLNNIDIRKHGSGNAGATNSLRVLGKKAGAIVFFGDLLKALIPCLAVRLLFATDPDRAYVDMLYIGLGAVLGHNFPFYLGFKGGKGVACTGAIILAFDVRIAIICLLVFITIVFFTRYVSLASIAVMFCFGILVWIFSARGFYGLSRIGMREVRVLSIVIGTLSLYMHRANILRLIRGTENKIFAGK